MNWEVVQDFLNVSGIKGVALIDGQSRPYFKGIEKVLNSQQREALAQGVWQVLETIPENFDSFEFQFAGTQVYIHKMTQGLILLVLTHDSLLYPDYCEAFTKLKAAFEADGEATLESFRRLLGARSTTAGSPADLSSGASRNVSPDISADAPTAGMSAETQAPVEAAGNGQASRSVAQEAEIAREIAQNLAAQNGQGGAAFTAASAIPDASNPAAQPVDPQGGSQVIPAARPDLEDTLPDIFPEESAPEDAIPEDAIPEDSVTAAATPEDIFPAEDAPEEAIPDVTETAAPGTAPSQNSVPLDGTLVDNPFAASMAAPPDSITETFAELPDDLPDQVGLPDVEADNSADAALPDVGLPEVGLPEVGLPDAGDVGLPNVGGAELPDADLPDDLPADLPSDFSLDDVALTDEDVPVASPAAAVSIPASSVPDSGVPDSGIDTEASAQGLPLEDWLAALNCLGQCAVHYLGRAVVVNYWRKSCPESDWLANFDVERSSTIKAGADLPLAHGTTVEQQLELQDWADRFSQRCGRVIRDFPQLAETQGLSPEQRELLGL